MRNWIACSTYSILFLSLAILCIGYSEGQSQSMGSTEYYNRSAPVPYLTQDLNTIQDTTRLAAASHLPEPKSVLYKSMILPGWGQIINRQAWKVPIIYGLLGGLGYYSVYLTKKYHDYRAAFYNLNPDTQQDFRFGSTPAYIPDNANIEELRSLRNTFKNRRDLVYVGLFLAYGLNLVDAYVFAHMRSFDISEDLSMRTRIQPSIMAQRAPGFTLSIDLISK